MKAIPCSVQHGHLWAPLNRETEAVRCADTHRQVCNVVAAKPDGESLSLSGASDVMRGGAISDFSHDEKYFF